MESYYFFKNKITCINKYKEPDNYIIRSKYENDNSENFKFPRCALKDPLNYINLKNLNNTKGIINVKSDIKLDDIKNILLRGISICFVNLKHDINKAVENFDLVQISNYLSIFPVLYTGANFNNAIKIINMGYNLRFNQNRLNLLENRINNRIDVINDLIKYNSKIIYDINFTFDYKDEFSLFLESKKIIVKYKYNTYQFLSSPIKIPETYLMKYINIENIDLDIITCQSTINFFMEKNVKISFHSKIYITKNEIVNIFNNINPEIIKLLSQESKNRMIKNIANILFINIDTLKSILKLLNFINIE